jgi:uncharacterized heparinase superfamily protein
MTTGKLLRLRRAFSKPPGYVAQRAAFELHTQLERIRGPRRASRFDIRSLLLATDASSLDELWERLATQPYLAHTNRVNAEQYEQLCPGDAQRILNKAEAALNHEVNLLGSGPVQLGREIEWNKDYKSGYSWPNAYFHDIDYINPNRPSDVKFAWEVSRLQWTIPAGQAFLFSGEEKYAASVRELLEQWIAANPYGYGVNWACTMEVALRIFSWTWLFRVFANSESWHDREFRSRFLCSLFLHADFTERHIERADINGNHYTADAAGLGVAGLFFGSGRRPEVWAREGWRVLTEELPRQVFPDGVDFEASSAYHRLVMELVLFVAIYRRRKGLEVPEWYQERLVRMADFVAAYSRPDGSSPFWGDADDARVLPFGGQSLTDHRYLVGLVASEFDDSRKAYVGGPRDEILWIRGTNPAKKVSASSRPRALPSSSAFRDGGVYIMRNHSDHIFIDCGPVGLGGRGGHGHSDCLSFEAVLNGTPLICDCGAYVYTASFEERNLFRSTPCHNTPRIDGEEINRFMGWQSLWALYYDAIPEVRHWAAGSERDEFRGAHLGYRRLAVPITPVRDIILEHDSHSLLIRDQFEGSGSHQIEIPLHLDPEVEPEQVTPGLLLLRARNNLFELRWNDIQSWQLEIEPARISPSYGIVRQSKKLVWRRSGPPQPLDVRLRPEPTTAFTARVQR